MTQDEVNNALDNLRAEIKNLSDRELLEQIYVLLKINTLSTICSNSAMASIMNPRNPSINSQFGNL